MPASASLSALALGEGDVEGEWRHSQETRFHSRETRSGCGRCCGGVCAAALAVPGVRAVRSTYAAAACARALGAKEGGGPPVLSCERGVALLCRRRACGPPVPVLYRMCGLVEGE